jgi:hypothetical protein
MATDHINILTPAQAKAMADIKASVSFGQNAVFSVLKSEVEPDTKVPGITSGKPWAIWGTDNKYPQIVIDENMAQETSASSLLFKIQAHYGKGLFFHKKEIDEKGNEKITPIQLKDLDPEIKAFYYLNDLENFYQGIINDYEWWNFFHCQYIPNKAGNKIVGVNWIRTKDVRSALRNPKTGKVDKFFLSGSWPNPEMGGNVVELPAFDPLNPFAEPNAIKKHQLVSIDRDYYPTAHWQSNFRWLQVAKSIPSWILANIKNSVNIKYHVEIPEQYFIDLYPTSNYASIDLCLAARKAAEAAIKVEIDNCLAGEENASKIFYTKFAVDNDGKVLPGWKITPLNNELKDQAWLNPYDTAAAAICTAHNVDPELSGVRMSKALVAGSGSNIREKFNFHMQLKTVIPRQTTLEVWETVKRINQWDEDIHLGFRDVYLETTDKSKTGTVIQNEQSPTALG